MALQPVGGTSGGTSTITDADRAECSQRVWDCMAKAAADYKAGRISLFQMDQQMAMCLLERVKCLSEKAAEKVIETIKAIAATIDNTIYNLTGHHAGDIIVIGLTIYVIFQLVPLILVAVGVVA